MSKEEKGQAIHPRITQLVLEMERIKAMLQSRDLTGALAAMRLCLMGLKPEDKPKELLDKVNREIAMLDAYENNTQRLHRLRTCEKMYGQWFGGLSDLLWTAGYYSNAKYGGFHDPSGGQRSR